MLTTEENRYFDDEQAMHEEKYLVGTNPRQQPGFGRDERDWERYRRVVVAPVKMDGAYLDIGCANGLLMESIANWAQEDGYHIEPYGLDISARLAELAREPSSLAGADLRWQCTLLEFAAPLRIRAN